ncbi:MaoC/PaaZ C-terminal domain-containing protein [Nocardioides humi]|uniref:MaoC family dehydratase n=1 Tax=Nocardioides humi TaxID=449461 RepID=A0ABN2B4F5_9ACTN|nr:MaoC/PaaZ C-terminal domain-containing protein [Nocardioides humi]
MSGPDRQTVVVDRARLVSYAAASGDLNPLHWHEASARRAGLDDVIAHGMLTMGLATSTLVNGLDDPGRVSAVVARFARPLVVPDDTEVRVDVGHEFDAENPAVASLIVVDAGGEPFLTRARLELDVPEGPGA